MNAWPAGVERERKGDRCALAQRRRQIERRKESSRQTKIRWKQSEEGKGWVLNSPGREEMEAQ